MNQNTLIVILFSFLLYNCDYIDPINTFEPILVIEGYLTEGMQFSKVILKQTVSDDDLYNMISDDDNNFNVISNADVALSVDDTLLIQLVESINKPGRYIVDLNYDSFIAKPNHKIKINCIYEDEHLIAETIIPDIISIDIHFPKNDIYIDSTDSVVLDIIGQSDNFGYLVNVDENEEIGSNAQLVHRDYYQNERSFLTTDNSIVIPKNFFHYYDIEYKISILNLDQNLFDFYRSLTNPLFNPEPVIMHVDGGLGIFGSSSKAEASVVVKKMEG